MRIIIRTFIESVLAGVPAVTSVECFSGREIDEDTYAYLVETVKNLPLEEKMRIYNCASSAARGEMRELLEKDSFGFVREMIARGTIHDGFYDIKPVISKSKSQISLPLRVNWCGSWTDTPPYSIENGGAVVNAAVKINNILPVRVLIEKLNEPKVVLEYFDSGCRGEFSSAAELSDLSNPNEPFPLLKSALIVCGIVPMPGLKTSENIFNTLGGGVFLSTGVIGIPKGSGLGTSSILLAACIKAIFDFTGQQVSDEEICRRVLLAEQLMGTGGGWQDQAGGMTNGIKLVSSASGYRQEVSCERIQAPKKFMDELSERFCIVYSGQRRLGRTVLREIMGGYIKSDPVFTVALKRIHSLAGCMVNNIKAGNMNGFLDNINEQNELTKTLDTGHINDRVRQIIDVSADMTAGMIMCGAGGGGFIQIFLEKGCSSQILDNRLKSAFPGQSIAVWDCGFV